MLPRMALLGLIIALVAAVPRAAAAAPATDAAPVATQPAAASPADAWSALEPNTASAEPRPLERRRGNTPQSGHSATGTGTTQSWFRTTMSLAGVVGLIVLLGWGYRRVAATGTFGLARGRGAPLIEVVGRTALSPRHSVCLVRVGPRLVLLGCTHDSIRSLDVITDPDLSARLLGQAAQQRADSHSAEFAKCLEREAVAYQDDPSGPAEDAVPDESRLAELKQKLGGTLQRLRAVTGV